MANGPAKDANDVAVDVPVHNDASDDSSNLDELLFKQELNEVYLLLDFISGRPDKHLASLDSKIEDPVNRNQKLSSQEIIQRVSTLRYPPDTNLRKKAEDAAFLLLVKDALNSIAYPARGMTIAYTTMFAEEGRETETNRLQAARLAYPGLRSSAAWLRKIKAYLTWIGLLSTVISAILLWQVTYGAQLAARFDEAKRNDTTTAAKVHDELNRQRVKDQNTSHDLVKTCRLKQATGTENDDDRDSALQQICAEYAYRHAQLCVAIADVGEYSEFWVFKGAKFLLPVHQPNDALECDGTSSGTESHGKKGRQEDAQSIAGVLAVMSNYLLPILFGLVGTLAALVRGIQDRITDSILSPRDRSLVLIRVPLGMIAGVCVGLFLSPDTVTARTAGNVGSFTISASGIAFLAGYGSEAFFRALDTLLERVFSFDKAPPNRAVP